MSNAVDNNNRLFPPFARKLAENDPTVYATFADRLAVWLGSERAYYPTARPEIVKLLLTAHATLRRAVGADANSNVPFHISSCIGHPMTAPYARLLKAVHPYRDLFVESDLRGTIRHLLSTVYIPPAISPDSSDGSGLSDGLVSPLNGQILSMLSSSSSLASALEMRPSSSNLLSVVSPRPPSQASDIISNTSVLSSDCSPHPHRSVSTRPPQLVQTPYPTATTTSEVQQNFIAVELHSASPVGHRGGSTSIGPALRKKKKSKFELSSLVAKDLEELSRKRAIKQEPLDSLLDRSSGPPVSKPSSTREDPTDSSPIGLVDVSGMASIEALDNTNPDSPSVMDIETEQNHIALLGGGHPDTAPDQPRNCEQDIEMTNVLTASGSAIVSAGVLDISGETEHLRTGPDREGASGAGLGSILTNDVDMADDTGLVPVQQAEPRAVSVSLIPNEKNGCDVSCDAASADCDMSGGASKHRHAAGVDTGILAQDLAPCADGEPMEAFDPGDIMPTATPGLVSSPLSILNTTLPSGIDIGHDLRASFVGQSGRTVDAGIRPADISSGVHHEPQSPIVTDSPSIASASHLLNNSSESPEAATPINKAGLALMPILDLVSSPNTTPKQNLQTSEVQLALQELSPSTSPMSPPSQTALGVFGGKMCILAIHRGSSNNNKITLRFDIPEEQLRALEIWNNRGNAKEGLQESLCVSLACYRAKSSEQKTVDQLSALPACWPQIGGLTMEVQYKGRREEFPLSPPFMVASNGLVDLSEFLSLGCNVIELHHRLDMSAYIFVLRAHSPTHIQLEEVAQRRRKKQEWHEWLLHVSRPLNIPLPPFS